ncbi:MAG: MCE family protein, partial [bacterium]|nr:MCE family protein [bacterium]
MPAKKHNFTLIEIKAGLMVIAAVIIFLVFVAAVNGLRPPKEMNTFYAYFKDSQGLNRRADVRFGGTVAGQVMSIELDETRPTELRVTAQVSPRFPINADCVAMIGQTTLTAEKHLEITTGEEDAERLASGAEIQTGGGSLFNQADEIARNVNEVVEHVIDLLGVDDYAEDEEEAAQKEKEELTTVSDIFADLGKTVQEGTGFVKDVRGVVEDSQDDIGD